VSFPTFKWRFKSPYKSSDHIQFGYFELLRECRLPRGKFPVLIVKVLGTFCSRLVRGA